MKDQFRSSGGRGCQRERRAASVRSHKPVLPDRQGGYASLWRLATVGIAVLLILGWGNDRAWAQRNQGQSPASAPAGTGAAPPPQASAPARRGQIEVTPPPPGMSFTTHLDYTAIWVGDHFHYMIIVDHSPSYEFVLDTLSKETVNLEPFQVVDLSTRTVSLKNGNRQLYVDLALASYITGKTSEQIPQLTLFYFRRDRKTTSAQEAAAESLTIPGPVIGLRSTLPPEPAGLRDEITLSGWDRSRWWVAGTGFLSLVLLVAGVGWETTQFVRKRRARKGPDRRKAMEGVRNRWAMGVPTDFSSTQTVMEFYDRCYCDLKEYLGYYVETSALGLTSEEIGAEMQRLGTDRGFAEKVTNLLGTLETSRYSANGTASSQEAAEKTAQEVREIFAFGSKG